MRTAVRWRSPHRRFGFRLGAAMLAISLPLLIILGTVLLTSTSSDLISASRQRANDVAKAVTERLDGWLSERLHDIAVTAIYAKGRLDGPGATTLLSGFTDAFPQFTVIES